MFVNIIQVLPQEKTSCQNRISHYYSNLDVLQQGSIPNNPLSNYF